MEEESRSVLINILQIYIITLLLGSFIKIMVLWHTYMAEYLLIRYPLSKLGIDRLPGDPEPMTS